MRHGLALFCLLLVASTPVSAAELPASWTAGLELPVAPASKSRLASMDFEVLAAEDALSESLGQPPRFALPHDVSISPLTSGQWLALDDGTSVWRYRIQAGNAVSLNFGFRDVRMPEGAALYFYTPEAARTGKPDRYKLIGPFGTDINEKHGQFWTPLLASSDVVIELNVPTVLRDQVSLELFRIGQGYRGFGLAADGYRQNASMTAGEGKSACDAKGAKSGSCNTDVACLGPEDPWNDPRRAVGAYSIGGNLACTGSLLNNTAEDRRMLFVTATHCTVTAANAASVVVYWNYEWPSCRTPGDAIGTSTNPPNPASSQSGATFLAATKDPFNQTDCLFAGDCSDMTLLELDDPAHADFNVYWAGWDRSGTAASCGPAADASSTDNLCASIHHPSVDEKRITFVETDLVQADIAGAQGIHWQAFWDPSPPILPNIAAPQPATLPPSVTEPGSSGSPLYNADKRLVGVLSGGASFCGATGNSLSDQYGQLAHAWEGLGSAQTRMRDYLDPQGSAPTTLGGLSAASNPNPPTTPDPICSNPGTALQDQAAVSDTLNTTGGTIDNIEVSLNISHTYVGDTTVVLTHVASGTSVTLYDRPGVPASNFGCSGDNVQATFSDSGAQPAEDACTSGTPGLSGTFKPVTPLSAFNGLTSNSEWRLEVTDAASGDTGTLNQWCVTITEAGDPEADLKRQIGGNYFDPDRDGEGCQLTLEGDENTFILTCYVYLDGKQVWLIGPGELANGTLAVPDMIVTSGADFGSAFNPADVVRTRWGRAELTPQDCNNADVTLESVLAGFGTYQNRLTKIVAGDCALSGNAIDFDDRIGNWFDPNRDGEGFQLSMEAGRQAWILTWYTYLGGEQVWLIGAGQENGNQITFQEMAITGGADFGADFRAEDVNRQIWGSITLDFSDCNTGVARVRPTIAGFESLDIDIQRIVSGTCSQ